MSGETFLIILVTAVVTTIFNVVFVQRGQHRHERGQAEERRLRTREERLIMLVADWADAMFSSWKRVSLLRSPDVVQDGQQFATDVMRDSATIQTTAMRAAAFANESITLEALQLTKWYGDEIKKLFDGSPGLETRIHGLEKIGNKVDHDVAALMRKVIDDPRGSLRPS